MKIICESFETLETSLLEFKALEPWKDLAREPKPDQEHYHGQAAHPPDRRERARWSKARGSSSRPEFLDQVTGRANDHHQVVPVEPQSVSQRIKTLSDT